MTTEEELPPEIADLEKRWDESLTQDEIKAHLESLAQANLLKVIDAMSEDVPPAQVEFFRGWMLKFMAASPEERAEMRARMVQIYNSMPDEYK